MANKYRQFSKVGVKAKKAQPLSALGLETIKSILVERAGLVTYRMYRDAAIFGATRTLIGHFGTIEPTHRVGLVEQVEWLFSEDGLQTTKTAKWRLALTWALHRLPATQTSEASHLVNCIQKVFAKTDPNMGFRFLDGVLLKYAGKEFGMTDELCI